MRISWLAVAAATLAFCGSAHATEFVTNGDFSSNGGVGQLGYNTSATGWSVPAPPGSYTFLFDNGGNTSISGQYGQVYLWTNSTSGNGWDGTSPSGQNFVGMDSDFHTGALTQQINGLTVGNQYTLTFKYAFGQQAGYTGDTLGLWNVSLGNSTTQTPISSVPSEGFSGWKSDTITFTADSTSELLSFLAEGSPQVPPFALLSDVSLVGAPAPGPATGPLAVLALLALGYARLRRAQA